MKNVELNNCNRQTKNLPKDANKFELTDNGEAHSSSKNIVEDKRTKIFVPDNVKEVLSRLEKNGFTAYIVGGKVRDMLLNIPSNDFDVATSARPNEVKRLFSSDMTVIPTGIKHGTVTVIAPPIIKSTNTPKDSVLEIKNGTPIEITTYRKDGTYSDFRRPDNISFSTNVEEDLRRRDFTINAMAYREQDGILDLFNGERDLENCIIRCVGDPEKRFSEDALRIMRAFRFCAKLNFDIEEETLKWALNLSNNLKNIANERISNEFMRLLECEFPSKSLLLMGHILNYILDLDEISTKKIKQIDKIRPIPEVRLAYLLYGQSREKVQKCVQFLRLSNKSKNQVLLLSEENKYFVFDFKQEEKNVSIMEFARRILAKYGSLSNDYAKIVCICNGRNDYSKISSVLNKAKLENPCLHIKDLKINGNDLIKYGIANGAKIGKILECLLDMVIINPKINDQKLLLNIAKKIEKKR